MKKLILMFLFIFPLQAMAWDKNDTRREVAWQIIHAIDYGQTLDIAKNPHRFTEGNPILGRHPSTDQVHAYMLTGALLHYAVARKLKPKYRKLFQYVSIGLSGSCVVSNARIGIKINF